MSDEIHGDHAEEPGYGLPFTVCRSQGGPFDDDAFVAGYRCGGIDADLAQPDVGLYDTQARTEDLPQLDLIAMRRGFTMEATALDDEWQRVVFTRASAP